MKAVLILDDIPSCCELCYLNRQREKGRYCVITNTYDKKYGNVKEDCPLKPLPQIKGERLKYLRYLGANVRELQCYAIGYDDCIDEILGEENE